MAPDVPLVHIRDRASKVPPERFPELHLPGAPGSRRDRGFRFPDEQGQVLSHHEARKEEESKKRKPFPAHGPHYEPDPAGVTIWPDLMPSSSWTISFLRQYPSDRPPTYTVLGACATTGSLHPEDQESGRTSPTGNPATDRPPGDARTRHVAVFHNRSPRRTRPNHGSSRRRG